MLKNIFSIALVGAMLLPTGCILTIADDNATSTTDDPSETGDGDGDGDATTTGDGDGDGVAAPATGAGGGAGDATPAGGGGGDAPAGPANMCGWDEAEAFYACGLEGEDPSGTFPIGCPDGLAEGVPCADIGLSGEGCCDANGDNWYCGLVDGAEVAVFASCAG